MHYRQLQAVIVSIIRIKQDDDIRFDKMKVEIQTDRVRNFEFENYYQNLGVDYRRLIILGESIWIIKKYIKH